VRTLALLTLLGIGSLAGCVSTTPHAKVGVLPRRVATCTVTGSGAALLIRNEGPGDVEVRWEPVSPFHEGTDWRPLPDGADSMQSSPGDRVVGHVRTADEMAVVRFEMRGGSSLGVDTTDRRDD
jgi:hypothetical protein